MHLPRVQITWTQLALTEQHKTRNTLRYCEVDERRRVREYVVYRRREDVHAVYVGIDLPRVLERGVVLPIERCSLVWRGSLSSAGCEK